MLFLYTPTMVEILLKSPLLHALEMRFVLFTVVLSRYLIVTTMLE